MIFTWNRKDKSEATRIDYFLVSTEILMNSYSSDIRPIVLKFTDHTSISLYISLFLTAQYSITNFDIKNRNQNKICRFPQHVLITSFHTLK
jgi:hypothetical protein